MSEKHLTPYEQAMRNLDRIIAELDAEIARMEKEDAKQWPTT